MDQETVTTQEVQQVEIEETPTPDTEQLAQPEEREIVDMEAAPEGEPAAETWEPNYKFKVKDQELEFDEWARPLVKDKDVEDKFRDVFSKAHGIDDIKSVRDTLRQELDTVKPEYERITGMLDQVSNMVQNKDYKSFFNALQIPKEDILKYAVSELKYQEMSPEERQKIDAQDQAQQRLRDLEEQNQSLSKNYQETVHRQMTTELDTQLSRPDISEIVTNYDTRMGRPGAFKQEIYNRGALYEQTYGKTYSATELVNELVQILGGTPQPQASVAPQPGSGQTPVVKPEAKQTLPNIQGAGGSSPSKKRPKSLDDLRELRRQMTSQV